MTKSPRLALSDRGTRENDEFGEFDDVDLNQLYQIYNKFVPINQLMV